MPPFVMQTSIGKYRLLCKIIARISSQVAYVTYSPIPLFRFSHMAPNLTINEGPRKNRGKGILWTLSLVFVTGHQIPTSECSQIQNTPTPIFSLRNTTQIPYSQDPVSMGRVQSFRSHLVGLMM